MNIRTVEALINELLAPPIQSLAEEQRQLASDYAAGLFVGRVEDLDAETDLDLGQLQGMHTLSYKQTFFMEYFWDDAGKDDAQRLGILGMDHDVACRALTDVSAITASVDGDERKAIAERSGNWGRAQLAAQLAQPSEADIDFQMPLRLSVNYNPDKLLAKAAAIRAYRRFYGEALKRTSSEPDGRLADAKRALIRVHAGRLNAMAATDVFPGLLSLEEQLTRSAPNRQIGEWTDKLRAAAPVIGDIHDLDDEARLQVREAYIQHLDAIRQGAPFELDEIEGREAALFSDRALHDLVDALKALPAQPLEPQEPTELVRNVEGMVWNTGQIKTFVEAVLREWDMLSRYAAQWQVVDDRDGWAEDGKFQVVVTPRRANVSVDSTRRLVNIPEGCERLLASQYPAGVLPLVAHELSHVLQSYADDELGAQIPLARIKGRRYRILREAGGVYQEKIIGRDYFGAVRGPNEHYVDAYVAKSSGESRIRVARVFYDSIKNGRQLSPEEDEAARAFAVNRTARLYRHGGQNSQVLDYVEQSVVCDVLMQRLEPERVDALLLGSTSFSLEDSAELHRYGLLTLPTRAAFSPAHEVMRVFAEQFYAALER